MKSWAVPKGPSLNPADKHLAVHVEDHPISYNEFEGQIPKGEYGAGEVIIWDRGTYEADHAKGQSREKQEQTMLEDLEKGKLAFTLHGDKLEGSWTLVHTGRRPGKANEWLLIKHQDEFVSDVDVLKEDRSVVSGRTIEDVRAGRKGVAVQKKKGKTSKKKPDALDLSSLSLPGSKKSAPPDYLAPMVPT